MTGILRSSFKWFEMYYFDIILHHLTQLYHFKRYSCCRVYNLLLMFSNVDAMVLIYIKLSVNFCHQVNMIYCHQQTHIQYNYLFVYA